MSPIPTAPQRPMGSRFTPLITAEQGFPAFETLVADARESIWLAFRIFDPETQLRGLDGTHGTWLDLLRAKLSEGVSVRVMLADFDPIGAADLHEATWRTVRLLGTLSDSGSIEVLPVRHEARVGRGMRVGLWILALKELERQRTQMNAMAPDDRSRAFSLRPGLWRYLRQRKQGDIAWRLAPLPRLFPATLHHKLCVVDAEQAIIGGLDIDERRYDDRQHDRAAEDTWHDVSVSVDGPVAIDIARHIADIWNGNRLRMAALRREQSRKKPASADDLPAPASQLPMPDAPDVTAEGEGLKVVRTVSTTRRRELFRVSPDNVVAEIETELCNAIRAARHSIYIETQFFRSKTIADTLAQAAVDNRDLNLVLIVPAAPEDVAFAESKGFPDRFGEHLQSVALKRLTDAFADRVAILSPVRPVGTTSHGRDMLSGSPIIYVHSKVAVFDRELAIIGSANLNGRSMRWDTEAAIACSHPAYVEDLYHQLVHHWTISPDDMQLLGKCRLAASEWLSWAQQNASHRHDDRRGFLVPYDREAAERMGRNLPSVPEELV